MCGRRMCIRRMPVVRVPVTSDADAYLPLPSVPQGIDEYDRTDDLEGNASDVSTPGIVRLAVAVSSTFLAHGN